MFIWLNNLTLTKLLGQFICIYIFTPQYIDIHITYSNNLNGMLLDWYLTKIIKLDMSCKIHCVQLWLICKPVGIKSFWNLYSQTIRLSSQTSIFFMWMSFFHLIFMCFLCVLNAHYPCAKWRTHERKNFTWFPLPNHGIWRLWWNFRNDVWHKTPSNVFSWLFSHINFYCIIFILTSSY